MSEENKSIDASIEFSADIAKAKEAWERFSKFAGQRDNPIPAEQPKYAGWGTNSPLYGDDSRWDIIAFRKSGERVQDVLVDGVSVKMFGVAVSYARSEVFCYPHRTNDKGDIEIIDPATALPGESSAMYIARGQVEVIFDGITIDPIVYGEPKI